MEVDKTNFFGETQKEVDTIRAAGAENIKGIARKYNSSQIRFLEERARFAEEIDKYRDRMAAWEAGAHKNIIIGCLILGLAALSGYIFADEILKLAEGLPKMNINYWVGCATGLTAMAFWSIYDWGRINLWIFKKKLNNESPYLINVAKEPETKPAVEIPHTTTDVEMPDVTLLDTEEELKKYIKNQEKSHLSTDEIFIELGRKISRQAIANSMRNIGLSQVRKGGKRVWVVSEEKSGEYEDVPDTTTPIKEEVPDEHDAE